MNTNSSKSIRRTLFIILLLAFALRLAGVWFGYPWLRHYDEVGEIIPCAFHLLDFHQSQGVAKITHNGPLLKYFMAAVLGIWGLIGSIFTSLNSIVENWKTTTSAYILGRILLGTLPGTAMVWIIYLIGKRLNGLIAGLSAAFIAAVAFKLVEFSHYATSDITAVFFVTCILFFTLRHYHNGKIWDIRLAGIFWAAATAAKLSTAPALIIPFAGILLKYRFKNFAWFKDLLNLAFFAIAGLLIFHLPYIAKPLEFIRLVLNTLLVQTFFFEKGFFWYFHPHIFPANDAPAAGIGWILLAVSLLGLIISLFTKNHKKWIVLVFPLIFYLILGISQVKHTRYLLPMLPFLCLWGGIAFAWLDKIIAKFLPPKIRYIIIGIILILAAYPNIKHSIVFALQASDGNTLLELSDALPEILDEKSTWAKLGSTPTKPGIPGQYLQIGLMGSAKEKLSRAALRDLKSRIPNVKDWVESHRETDDIKTLSWTELSPDSLFSTLKIDYIIIDEYQYRTLKETPDNRIRHLDEFEKARKVLKYIEENGRIAAEFKPRCHQTWGEGFAGRQPAIWVYRFNTQDQ